MMNIVLSTVCGQRSKRTAVRERYITDTFFTEQGIFPFTPQKRSNMVNINTIQDLCSSNKKTKYSSYTGVKNKDPNRRSDSKEEQDPESCSKIVLDIER